MGSAEPPSSSRTLLTNPEPITVAPLASGHTYQHATNAVMAALAFNFLIAGLKLLAWFFSGSSAMLSEGLHSLGDGMNSIALITGVKMSSKEPDETHPFGYGLEASVWAIPASAFLLIFSGVSVWEGWKRFHEVNNHIDNFFWAAGILLISIVMEFFAVQYAAKAVLEEVGVEAYGWDLFPKALKSMKLVRGPTTRFVFYEDGMAFLGALIALLALTLSYLSTDWGFFPKEFAHWPDALASMVIGLMLMGMSIYLFKHNRGILTGTAAAPTVDKKIYDRVINLHGVSEVHDLITIDRGPAGLTIHMKVEVDPDTQVKDVDDLIERIKTKLATQIHHVRKDQVFIEVLADESEIEWGEQFNQLIEQGTQDGVLKPREKAMLQSVYDFTESVVSDIMVPRMDAEYVEVNESLNDVADLLITSGHSRLPVYKDHIDDVVGIIHARDVFDQIRLGQMDRPLADIIREVDIYPENKPVSDLLEDFKRKKIQMAVVADEHGGFAGLVTIEDLLEEIVGDIWDEHDIDELLLEILSPTQLLVNGKYEIEDLNDRFGCNIPTDEFKTVGGFVFGTLGREPEQDDKALFEDLTFTVTDVEGPRIKTVMIESPVPFPQEPQNEEQEAASAGE